MSSASPIKDSITQKSKGKPAGPIKNGGLKGKNGKQAIREEAAKVNNVKNSKTKPPDHLPDVRQPSWPIDPDPSKMSPTKSKPPKTPEKLVNGGGLVNGNVGKAHSLFFPAPPFSFASPFAPGSPLLPGPPDPTRKRSSVMETSDIQTKISSILAQAPQLRPAEKKDGLPPPGVPVLPMVPTPSPRAERARKSVPRKGTERGRIDMHNIAPSPSDDRGMTSNTSGKDRRGIAPSPRLPDSVAQFVAAAPFSLAGPPHYMLPPNTMLQNLIPLPPNLLMNPGSLPSTSLQPVISPTTQNLFLMPAKPDPPATKNFKNFKKQKRSPEPSKPEKVQLQPVEPVRSSATTMPTVSTPSFSIAHELDQILSSVQSRISEFGTLSRNAVFPPSSFPTSPPLPPLSTTSVPSFGSTTSLPSFGTFTSKGTEPTTFGTLANQSTGSFPSIPFSGPSSRVPTAPRLPVEVTETPVCVPIDPKIARKNLKKVRERMKLALVDRGFQEDMEAIKGMLDKVELSPEGARKVKEVPRKEGQTSVLPFKKRLYKSVPSPKSSESAGRNVFQTGTAKTIAAPNVSTPGTPSPKASTKSKETPPLATISTEIERHTLTGSGVPLKTVRSYRKSKKLKPDAANEDLSSVPRGSSTASAPSISVPPLKLVLKKPKVNALEDAVSSDSPLSTVSVSPPPSLPPNKKRSADSSTPPGLKRRTSSTMIAQLGADAFNMTQNIYANASLRKPKKDVQDLGVCQCQPPSRGAKGCGETCMSRLLFLECDPAQCPCGDACSNQGIRKGKFVKDLEVFETETKGRGVRTRSDIKAGTLVCEYVGEVISIEKFLNRMSREYKECPHHYCLKLDGNTVIDAYRCGSLARYINHSCQPNCHVEKWTVDGQHRMIIMAFRDIAAGQEITYDYNFDNYSRQQKCFCGAKSCRGIIGSKTQKLNGLLMKKKPAASDLVNGLERAVSERSDASSRSGTVSFTSPPAVVAPTVLQSLAISETTFIISRRLYLLRNKRKTGSGRFASVLFDVEKSMTNRFHPWPRLIVENPRKTRRKPSCIAGLVGDKFSGIVLEALLMGKERSALPDTATNLEGTGRNERFPTSHFRPVRWEPSQAEVAMFTHEYHEEVVRCICNAFLEEGPMIECDECRCWQHAECMGVIASQVQQEYLCERCKPRATRREIPQNLPASSNPDNLDLYVSLMVPNIQDFQIRVGDCVYLTPDRKAPDPEKLYNLRDLDLIRIDKMYVDGDGVKRVFGFPFLWPHETHHEATRSFFPNELVYAPAYIETVALDVVLGRFCVMDPAMFAKGKPREFPLEHCYVCEFKYSRTTHNFSRMQAKDKVPMNPHKFYFETYTERYPLKKSYKPHTVPVLKKKLKAEAAKRKLDDAREDRPIRDVIRDKCDVIHNIATKLLQKSAHRSGLTAKSE